MRVSTTSTLGLMTGLLAALATTAAAQVSTTANGPYYATPSWDQKLTVNRFVILANWDGEAVLDRETGLVWERSPRATPSNWYQGHLRCTTQTLGNRKGWRMPGIEELTSLMDPSVAPPGPMLPPGHPFENVQPGGYWSATSGAIGGTVAAWFVNLSSGFIDNVSNKSDPGYIWCVRGGRGPDTP